MSAYHLPKVDDIHNVPLALIEHWPKGPHRRPGNRVARQAAKGAEIATRHTPLPKPNLPPASVMFAETAERARISRARFEAELESGPVPHSPSKDSATSKSSHPPGWFGPKGKPLEKRPVRKSEIQKVAAPNSPTPSMYLNPRPAPRSRFDPSQRLMEPWSPNGAPIPKGEYVQTKRRAAIDSWVEWTPEGEMVSPTREWLEGEEQLRFNHILDHCPSEQKRKAVDSWVEFDNNGFAVGNPNAPYNSLIRTPLKQSYKVDKMGRALVNDNNMTWPGASSSQQQLRQRASCSSQQKSGDSVKTVRRASSVPALLSAPRTSPFRKTEEFATFKKLLRKLFPQWFKQKPAEPDPRPRIEDFLPHQKSTYTGRRVFDRAGAYAEHKQAMKEWKARNPDPKPELDMYEQNDDDSVPEVQRKIQYFGAAKETYKRDLNQWYERHPEELEKLRAKKKSRA